MQERSSRRRRPEGWGAMAPLALRPVGHGHHRIALDDYRIPRRPQAGGEPVCIAWIDSRIVRPHREERARLVTLSHIDWLTQRSKRSREDSAERGVLKRQEIVGARQADDSRYLIFGCRRRQGIARPSQAAPQSGRRPNDPLKKAGLNRHPNSRHAHAPRLPRAASSTKLGNTTAGYFR